MLTMLEAVHSWGHCTRLEASSTSTMALLDSSYDSLAPYKAGSRHSTHVPKLLRDSDYANITGENVSWRKSSPWAF